MAIGNIGKLIENDLIEDPILKELKVLCKLFPYESSDVRILAYSEVLADMRTNSAHLKSAIKQLIESTKGFPEVYDIIYCLKRNNWIPEENERNLEKQKQLELETKERRRLFDLEAKEAEQQNKQYSEGSKETQRLFKLQSKVIKLINEGWEGELTKTENFKMWCKFGGKFNNPNCFDEIEVSAENAYSNGISKRRWIESMDNLYKSGNKDLVAGTFWDLLANNRKLKNLPDLTDDLISNPILEKINNPSKLFR